MREKSQITYPGLVSAASISAFQADGAGSNPVSRSIVLRVVAQEINDGRFAERI